MPVWMHLAISDATDNSHVEDLAAERPLLLVEKHQQHSSNSDTTVLKLRPISEDISEAIVLLVIHKPSCMFPPDAEEQPQEQTKSNAIQI